MEGVSDDHPWILAAQRSVDSVQLQWRLLYNLPPSDPRFLETTEEEMVFDLLQRHFVERRVKAETDPLATAVAEVAGDPALAEALVDRKDALLGDPGTARALRAMARGGRSEEEERPKGPLTLRVRSTVSAAPRKPVKP